MLKFRGGAPVYYKLAYFVSLTDKGRFVRVTGIPAIAERYPVTFFA